MSAHKTNHSIRKAERNSDLKRFLIIDQIKSIRVIASGERNHKSVCDFFMIIVIPQHNAFVLAHAIESQVLIPVHKPIILHEYNR